MTDTLPIHTGNGNAPVADPVETTVQGASVAEIDGDNEYAQIARKHWRNAKKAPKVKNAVVEEIWQALVKDGFTSLHILEQLQLLEKYLWPGYTEDASNHHVLLLTLMVNTKRKEGLPAWELFQDKAAEFSTFFRRALFMSIDQSLTPDVRTDLIAFIIGAFQSLDSGLIRKECAPLVSIGIWNNLYSEIAREERFEKNSALKKAWRAANKRYDGAEQDVKGRIVFERSWLFTLLLHFLDLIYQPTASSDSVSYCERFLELLIDLESQLPTRRYVNALLQDLNILSVTNLSPMYNDEGNGLFRDLYDLFRHFATFPIDDQTGQEISQADYLRAHHATLSRLQRTAFKHFPEKLKILALSNYSSLGDRKELIGLLDALDTEEMVRLCQLLGFRTTYPKSSLVVQDRRLYTEILLSNHEWRPTFQDTVRSMTLLPTERTLYDASLMRNEMYTGQKPLALPKLNLQYLTMGDFLWRSFILHRSESFYEIRKDMEDAIRRVQPHRSSGSTRFGAFSRLALPISKPAITDVALPKVGEDVPASVRAEIVLDVSRVNFNVRQEWEQLRHGDVVFLLAVDPPGESMALTNGYAGDEARAEIGLKHLRAAEVVQVQNHNGRPIREQQAGGEDGESRRVHSLRLIVNIDPISYKEDSDRMGKGKPSIYDGINLLVRRKGRENNFKPILESIKRLTLSDIPAPAWLQEVFLGFGDPSSANYKRLPNRLQSVDFRDTFLDWQHLVESLPGKTIEPHAEAEGSFGPPYVLQLPEEQSEPPAPPRQNRKRRRDQEDIPPATKAPETVQVSTYKPPNTGPYPVDAPKTNSVRFTPAQVEAVSSGTQPGLTVIIGPPGTGKTDVATQIINNIYHNFPSQRTLLIAHSNQALNQLFQKIAALDIDERHLLRLGHGEEELELETSYSKHGRVESFLERGAGYLAEVNRLANSLGAPGAHGNSCETADYFNQVYVKPTWSKYWDNIQSSEATEDDIVDTFPFHAFFANAPQPLFPTSPSKDALLNVARGCYYHIEKIFSELADIRPFEILRNPRDKANYLLVKEARIIAMTSTHAAMRRQEIADLGFHYDNVIMEEAAQITEIENFIPLALQNPKDGKMPLQRIVLCGDHLQNSPIIQNLAFRQYANLEQSLFLRLVRLGVPTVMLDQQGRARPSIASLYSWRYPNLGNLPVVSSSPEFLRANAGFRYDYQFIEVPDYQGKGEMEPTPHFIQNLGEAEYAVALYMYMRLLGYPGSRISILTTYAGQRALVRDVLGHRCKTNRLFGMPRWVGTVDKYQGEQNDYIILSLTRTTRPGYLRDIRRLTVALSRARLGLYVLGRRTVFESAPELQQAFAKFFERPDKLTLVTGEMHPTKRLLEDDVEGTAEMEGVEHLGKYVYEMTQAKIKALKENGGVLPPAEEVAEDEDDRDVGVEVDEPMQDEDGEEEV